MGYFGHWVVARGLGRLGFRRLGLRAAAAEAAPGWRYGYGSEIPHDLEALVDRAARAGGGAAAGAWVYDSDCAQVFAVNGELRAPLGLQRERTELDLDHDPDGFSRWSACAPIPLTADDLERIASRADVFAEETADELFDRLGLPAPYDPLEQPTFSARVMVTIGKPSRSKPPPPPTPESVGAAAFGGYVSPLGFMRDEARIDGERFDWRDLRHVPGLGEGLLGIWDREAPAAPAETFPVSRRGEARLNERLEELQMPLRVESAGASGLGGFREPLGLRSDMSIAGRALRLRDARYLVGKGDGFYGVWDRSRPGEPLERFRDDGHGREQAGRRAGELLFELELADKATTGLRLFRPATPSETFRVEELDKRIKADRRTRRMLRSTGPIYSETPGVPWLIVEEDDDPRWAAPAAGRFHVYALGRSGPFALVTRRETVDEAKALVTDSERNEGTWREVPSSVPPTLMATYRWAEREANVGSDTPWFERFEWVGAASRVSGERTFALAIDDGGLAGVLLAAGRGHEREPAAYLLRPGDGPRFVYSLDDLDMLRQMLERYLGAVQLSEWAEIPDWAPEDLATLAPILLRLADESMREH